MSDFENRIRRQIYNRVDALGGIDEEELCGLLDSVMLEDEYAAFPVKKKLELRRDIFNTVKRLDILQNLIDDDSVTEIMVNGYRDIFFERDGKIEKYDKEFESREMLLDVVQRIAARSNKIVNEALAIVDTRLDDGSRVNIVMNPIAIEGPAVTIRKFYDNPLTMERLIALGAVTQEAAQFLKGLVTARYNIFISGGTGSGKTTFLNALSNYIPKNERIITIEDSAELKLMGVDNLVRLEARNANMEGKNEVTIRDMIRASLRMRPDRIIVGEVRGGEALDMLQAMGTGHDGSLSTGHANGAEEMMLRLETMVLMAVDMPIDAVRNQIAAGIDIVVHLGRMRDGSRKVIKIAEIKGRDAKGNIRLNTLYEYVTEEVDEDGRVIGELKRTKNEFIHKDKLLAAGT
ncbi:pilus assembly protein CpaF [Firmicutes bacterium CAG:882]|jgi:pilus assembly protein CpaF|nr:pilus assembly protein CpaF [Firmicutes bacterium CAG:882]